MIGSKPGVVAVMILAAALSTPQATFAQQTTADDLKKEIEALKRSLAEIQKDLRDIKTLLQARQQPSAPQNLTLDLGDVPVRGERTAPLTLVEFTDYQ
jgi:protein-disulfide isomerase